MKRSRENFRKNLNYLKENRGFTVPWLSDQLQIEKRAVEKWFYEGKLPSDQNESALFKCLKQNFGVNAAELYGPPNSSIGKPQLFADPDQVQVEDVEARKLAKEIVSEMQRIQPPSQRVDLSSQEMDLLELFRSLSSARRDSFIKTLRIAASRDETQHNSKRNRS